jgi:hypothetical protein
VQDNLSYLPNSQQNRPTIATNLFKVTRTKYSLTTNLITTSFRRDQFPIDYLYQLRYLNLINPQTAKIATFLILRRTPLLFVPYLTVHDTHLLTLSFLSFIYETSQLERNSPSVTSVLSYVS